jgi:FkbM family methyltransferase
MNLKKQIARTPLIRPLFLRALRMMARDRTIINPWTGDVLRLNTFRHKGYWYFGKSREKETMERFAAMIKPGDTVIEVGGHIGFIAQYFAKLVGPSGRLIVFEPGSNNLPYIEANLAGRKHVTLERMAVSSEPGEAEFFEDNLTGQNNSLLDDYKGADGVGRTHGMTLVRSKRIVKLTTLADYMSNLSGNVDFLKIDIEGHELAALEGARSVFDRIKAIMVEVTEQQEAVGNLLAEYGFQFFDPAGNRLPRVTATFSGNLFAVRERGHS